MKRGKCEDIGPLHCYYLRNTADDRVLALIVQQDSHGVKAKDLANWLRKAATWFDQVEDEGDKKL